MYRSCTLCPRECRADRLSGETGFCGTGAEPAVSSFGPHFGEERVLTGSNGSGTIFFAGCNLGCVFCQNYEISHGRQGVPVSSSQLASIMLSLQKAGCHNINLVTPTHFLPSILQALLLALNEGLSIPVVYNCGGYEKVETIRMLEGIIDVYMPDAKFASDDIAFKFTGAGNYWKNMTDSLIEMHRQTGPLPRNRIAAKGLLIRHLVMPNNLAGTEKIMEFIARKLGPDNFVNIMEQYRPEYRAREFPEIARRPTAEELEQAYAAARKFGIEPAF